jgi:hypothetical protein
MAERATDDWVMVHTAHDFHDRPVSGIAEFRGAPHAFAREWDEAADDWSDFVRLSPITDEQLRAVQESQSIFVRWLARYHAGTLGPDDEHPALAEDWPRHRELKSDVAAALAVNEAIAVRAAPMFRGSLMTSRFEVRWLPAD